MAGEPSSAPQARVPCHTARMDHVVRLGLLVVVLWAFLRLVRWLDARYTAASSATRELRTVALALAFGFVVSVLLI
ncbi:hypothetical protein GCM10009725_30380 [Aeromicrobium tamlense]